MIHFSNCVIKSLISMKGKTVQKFRKLENQRRKLLEKLDAMPESALFFKEAPEKWNILQVVSHIVKSEALSLKYMERKAGSGDKLPKAGFSSSVRSFLLYFGLSLPVKYKAPGMVDTITDEPEYDLLKKDWNIVRENLKNFLEGCDKAILERAIYKHPRAGLLNADQAISFMSMHLSHHIKQIERIYEGSV